MKRYDDFYKRLVNSVPGTVRRHLQFCVERLITPPLPVNILPVFAGNHIRK